MDAELLGLFDSLDVHKMLVLSNRRIKRVKVGQQAVHNFVRKRVSKIDLKDLRYSQFEPLYKLWCAYFSSIHECNNSERILKADYHGCLLLVVEADNPSQIGICGIVVRETRQTFMLITKQDRVLTIPKQGTVFQFAFKKKIYTLFGNSFRFQPSLRAKKSMKNRLPIPYFLR